MEEMKHHPANSSPMTPIGFLERAATVYGECPSVIFNSTTYTWSQTHRRCLQVASSLASAGIKRGEVVSVLAPNIPALYELHFAVPMAGAVLNTVNTRLDSRTVSLLLQHGESKLIFVDYFSVDLVLESLNMFPANSRRPVLVLIDADEDSGEKRDFGGDVFVTSYEQMVEKGDPDFNWIRPKNEWDPIVLNYTSGTTSAPKGVVHCHRGLFIATFDALLEWAVPKNPIYLWTLPMFHANGWCYTWGMAAVGGTNICLRKFDGPVVYSLIEKHGVTHMCGAPVVLNMLANTPGQVRLKKPISIMTAGAPPPAAVLFKVEELGFDVCHGYGMTETCGLVLSCAWKPHWNKFPATEKAKLKARQGVRTNGMTGVDVIDPETGISVKHDGVSLGEIVLNGSCLALGYLKDKEATEKSITKDGWFITGDVGVIHPDGYLEIKDRSKDVIISGGENISSVEVESILYTHPAVDEAAVVARPDEFWGETPCAFVSLKKEFVGGIDERGIIEHCRSKMPHFMVPKTVVFKEELPKTSTGKLQKYILRDVAKAMGAGSIKHSKMWKEYVVVIVVVVYSMISHLCVFNFTI